ncbi:hypothetical protein E2C01_021360 [Portunus trituberculatus]|uniref:Uncharacterized protein n=1 Tax=Portunus trituberculatus TaxID=210409 RepID=A0A5B7E468_PORTR|nr:hypothetical protein [Portunus trituberculatus]
MSHVAEGRLAEQHRHGISLRHCSQRSARYVYHLLLSPNTMLTEVRRSLTWKPLSDRVMSPFEAFTDIPVTNQLEEQLLPHVGPDLEGKDSPLTFLMA